MVDPDPDQINTDPKHWCLLSGSEFFLRRDPDPAHQTVTMTTGLQTLHGSSLSLHTSIVSVHGPPWLHFVPRQLLNFDLLQTLEIRYTGLPKSSGSEAKVKTRMSCGSGSNFPK
jgi:hypothetical protein